jgi:hypothetical protein
MGLTDRRWQNPYLSKASLLDTGWMTPKNSETGRDKEGHTAPVKRFEQGTPRMPSRSGPWTLWAARIEQAKLELAQLDRSRNQAEL